MADIARRAGGLVDRLPQLGFGAAAIATNDWVTDEQAAECLQVAWDRGFRYFDTAPMYGSGVSERRLGQSLSNWPREQYLLSTKVGRLVRPGHPDDGVHRCRVDLRLLPRRGVAVDRGEPGSARGRPG